MPCYSKYTERYHDVGSQFDIRTQRDEYQCYHTDLKNLKIKNSVCFTQKSYFFFDRRIFWCSVTVDQLADMSVKKKSMGVTMKIGQRGSIELINSLNERGEREKELKSNIQKYST